MSWEEMWSRKYPCKCGKGFYKETSYMDDWNRTRETYIIECEECKEKYNITVKNAEHKPKHGDTKIVWEEKI